ncbi:hypothetical protein GCM10010116_27150 [Microbispora rosea subsp. aerata]|nr:hypothetical protein GCM10010116_27150 [Microbispora rosea subsp. aerata]GIH54010.1 hypothetical protein Mro02_09240 [Microbispora rosea subsp. aerata]GLJ84983.1 hypothetical protein GCM10017588_37110 [Microbispora rosea subsp. aerata]
MPWFQPSVKIVRPVTTIRAYGTNRRLSYPRKTGIGTPRFGGEPPRRRRDRKPAAGSRRRETQRGPQAKRQMAPENVSH